MTDLTIQLVGTGNITVLYPLMSWVFFFARKHKIRSAFEDREMNMETCRYFSQNYCSLETSGLISQCFILCYYRETVALENSNQLQASPCSLFTAKLYDCTHPSDYKAKYAETVREKENYTRESISLIQHKTSNLQF